MKKINEEKLEKVSGGTGTDGQQFERIELPDFYEGQRVLFIQQDSTLRTHTAIYGGTVEVIKGEGFTRTIYIENDNGVIEKYDGSDHWPTWEYLAKAWFC